MSHAIETARSEQVADLLVSLVRADGSAGHAYPQATELTAGPEAMRNLADAAHYLCVLHGRFPGVIEHAARKTGHPAARGWLSTAAEAFAAERALLTRLAVATGPLPSTPGQAECEAAVLQQRHALEMLSQSERAGCALGAAFALALDWQAVRAVLEAAARRASIAPGDCGLPGEEETRTVAMIVAETTSFERAMSFGAQQLLAQHRGLWDLLEARQQARQGLTLS
ncbi:hypothetical protein GON01_05745 [Sphingomonas sp. MAH-20]|jgi:hypothetical protein|uniref:Uncharacterized protein n=1 Tax=Sphingomonas horti TaxID=2682842 RepID=A0A6I4IYW5_9SPHN|nr:MULTISPECIES: hypothetical protein [Sphingomonas]MBA2918475.1 hypothetical protein [Sphingomonas sp. CGMCC 1.13658]MVO77442.1 hypothetical protein [Sphingomonas horti]